MTFRLADPAGLQLGSVLITDSAKNGEVQKKASLDEFARLGRDER
ncbi:hypothetical protein ACFY2R_09725 [Micromonospora olivasterospora]|nr:hypothetical protein [Micromonospora olivasterospora]